MTSNPPQHSILNPTAQYLYRLAGIRTGIRIYLLFSLRVYVYIFNININIYICFLHLSVPLTQHSVQHEPFPRFSHNGHCSFTRIKDLWDEVLMVGIHERSTEVGCMIVQVLEIITWEKETNSYLISTKSQRRCFYLLSCLTLYQFSLSVCPPFCTLGMWGLAGLHNLPKVTEVGLEPRSAQLPSLCSFYSIRPKKWHTHHSGSGWLVPSD